MQSGHVVRIGKIDHETLEEEWGDYVKLDAIVERRGKRVSEKLSLEQGNAELNSALCRNYSSPQAFRGERGLLEAIIRRVVEDVEKYRRNLSPKVICRQSI